MKKKISLFIATIMTMVALPVATFAAPATTDVTGTVTNNGAAVSGAHVTVTCNGKSKTVVANNSGDYLARFRATICPAGSHITVNAKKHKLTGSSSGTANAVDTKLNVAVVNVSLPELGAIGLVGAAVIGGGAFVVVRRRHLSDHQA